MSNNNPAVSSLVKTLSRRAEGHESVAKTYDKQIDDAHAEITSLASEQGSHYAQAASLRKQIDALNSLV